MRWPPRCRTCLLTRQPGQTPATRADGPSACPGDSSFERGSVSASDANWDMQQAAKSSRVRNAGENCVRGGFSITGPRPASRCENGLRAARVPLVKTPHGSPYANAGAAGAAFHPVVPHAPSGNEEQRVTGEPRAGQRQGATTHASMSSRAKRGDPVRPRRMLCIAALIASLRSQ